jgi:sulfur relay (sulfurtransferase) DsrF/TusC family protein
VATPVAIPTDDQRQLCCRQQLPKSKGPESKSSPALCRFDLPTSFCHNAELERLFLNKNNLLRRCHTLQETRLRNNIRRLSRAALAF